MPTVDAEAIQKILPIFQTLISNITGDSGFIEAIFVFSDELLGLTLVQNEAKVAIQKLERKMVEVGVLGGPSAASIFRLEQKLPTS